MNAAVQKRMRRLQMQFTKNIQVKYTIYRE